ncbi:MAG: DNA-3-methyladenine glycosylase I [Eubacteriales bacterium]|nr:DNA-3-methyladenine glycosylase I [Eubacteriales bacterium]
MLALQTPLKSAPICPWAIGDDLYTHYHDTEWGRPLHDDRALFELLILEGMQAGLSWLIVLRKREHFRVAFDGFDPTIVAQYGEAKIADLLLDAGIIRNRLKVRGAVQNAIAFLQIQAEFGSFDQYLWNFVGGQPVINHPVTMADVPPRSVLSDALSKDLKKRGMTFVGTTICYALMQSAGLVVDHLTSCSCYKPG